MLDKQKNQGVFQPYLRNLNVRWGEFDLSDLLQMRFEENENKRYAVCKNDLVVCEGGEPGRCAIWNRDEPIMFQKALHRIRCYEGVLNKYIQIILNIYAVNGTLKKYYTGSTIKHLTGDSLNSILFPLPPSSEQLQIIDEIERWFTLIDQIEQGKVNLQTTIKQTKSKILDLAIHGKLVPQNPNDEPASELLKRINPKAEITCDNGLYGKVPKGWCICHIEDVAESLLGKTLDKNKDIGEPKNYLCSINVQWDNFDLSTIKQCKIEQKDLERYAIKKGDLLVCEGGDVGRAAIWSLDKEMYYQNALHRIRFKGGISSRYFLYSFMFYKQCGVLDDISKGVTIKHFTQRTMNKISFPLPPLAEQQRIVDAIDKAFAKLDAIMESL